MKIDTQRDSVPLRDGDGISLRVFTLVKISWQADCLRYKKHIWATAKGNLHCFQWELSWQDACILEKEGESFWSSLSSLPILLENRGSSDSRVVGLCLCLELGCRAVVLEWSLSVLSRSFRILHMGEPIALQRESIFKGLRGKHVG